MPEVQPSSDLPDQPDGNVVDPAVLAERRARRAELAEESLVDRVRTAEQVAADLEARATELQQGLADAAQERDRLEQELHARESELVAVGQREEAERRRRHEVEVEGDADRRGLEAEVADLRARLGTAEARTAELAGELTQARAAAETLRQEAAAERGARERLEVGAQDVAALSRVLDGRREQVLAEIGVLRDKAGSLADELAAAEQTRAQAEARMVAERERAEAEVTLLQHELDRRAQIHDAVLGHVQALGAEVARVRDAASADAAQRAVTEAALVQMGETTERLERSLGVLARERDAAGTLLADARAALSARDEDVAGAQAELAAVRTELDAVRADAERQNAALAEERRGLEEQLGGAEHTVGLLHDRLAGAAQELAVAQAALVDEQAQSTLRVLAEREQTDAERARADTSAARAASAEGERDRLAAELAQRAALDDHVRVTLASLRAELTQVREQTDGQAAREAAVERLVSDLVVTAGQLREGFDRELAAVRGQFEERIKDARGVELAAAEDRLAAMRGHLQTSVLRLSEALQNEQAARRTAEDALVTERERVEFAGLAAVDAAVARDELSRELAERRGAEDDARAALAAAEEELTLLRREHAGQADALAVVESLTRAAQRLRSETPAANEPRSTAAPADGAGETDRPAGTGLVPIVEAPRAASTPSDGVLVRPHVVAPADRRPSLWLGGALTQLARTDPVAARSFLLALLRTQGPGMNGDLTYDLTVRGHGTWRVSLTGGAATVEPLRPESPAPDVSAVGELAALVPLAAGGAGRRLAGVDVHGSRRRWRRVLKTRRAPVDLGALSGAAGPSVSPGAVLRLLVGVVDPGWVAGHDFQVDYEVSGAAGGTWRMRARAGRLTVEEPPAGAPPPSATVRVADVALVPMLAALPLPPGERLLVSGDVEAPRLLAGWFAQAQGFAAA